MLGADNRDSRSSATGGGLGNISSRLGRGRRCGVGRPPDGAGCGQVVRPAARPGGSDLAAKALAVPDRCSVPAPPRAVWPQRAGQGHAFRDRLPVIAVALETERLDRFAGRCLSGGGPQVRPAGRVRHPGRPFVHRRLPGRVQQFALTGARTASPVGLPWGFWRGPHVTWRQVRWRHCSPPACRPAALPPPDARTIATMPALTGSGRFDHAVTTARRSGSSGGFGVQLVGE